MDKVHEKEDCTNTNTLCGLSVDLVKVTAGYTRSQPAFIGSMDDGF